MAYTAEQLAALRASASQKRLSADALAQRTFGNCSMRDDAHDPEDEQFSAFVPEDHVLVEVVADDIVRGAVYPPGTATAADILWGKTAWVDDVLLTGQHHPPTVSKSSDLFYPWTGLDGEGNVTHENGVWVCVANALQITVRTAISLWSIPAILGARYRLSVEVCASTAGCDHIEYTIADNSEFPYGPEDGLLSNVVEDEWRTISYEGVLANDSTAQGPEIGIRWHYDTLEHSAAAVVRIKNFRLIYGDWEFDDPGIVLVDEDLDPNYDYRQSNIIGLLGETEIVP